MTDWLTWEGIRALADVEALNLGPHLVLVQSDPRRPVIKWSHQYHWAKHARKATVCAGSIVYARAAWRAPWRQQMREQIQQPVVLVTTFYDPTIKPAAVAEMFPGPIRHWFGVQCAATHPQLTAMPVGIEGSMVPQIQAGERRETRDTLLYLNFQVRSSERATLWTHFAPKPWVTAERWANTGATSYIRALGNSKFVLSPPGFGWDCYRTYEALAMGAIPIVLRRHPNSDVCLNLPVLMVDDWAEVTKERLESEWRSRRPMETTTLTLTYWRERILRVSRATRGRGGEECTSE